VAFGDEADRQLTRVLVDAALAASTSDAGRKIQQGGVKIAGEKVSDVKARVAKTSLPLVVQAGRHAVRLVAG
jgi:tyrosyl-tRNA synthetase